MPCLGRDGGAGSGETYYTQMLGGEKAVKLEGNEANRSQDAKPCWVPGPCSLPGRLGWERQEQRLARSYPCRNRNQQTAFGTDTVSSIAPPPLAHLAQGGRKQDRKGFFSIRCTFPKVVLKTEG